MSKLSQREWVLVQLQAGMKLTSLDAYDEYGITQLGTRIFELRAEGHQIDSPLVEVRNRRGELCRVAEYRIVRQN